jgi:predicted nucleotidyltransferase component of viral defense system
MSSVLGQLLGKYSAARVEDYDRALREIMQQVILLGLWRGSFFEHAAFFGGTALRLVHGLDRFSEDLDFSLLEPDDLFDLGRFRAVAIRELSAHGVEAEAGSAEKPEGSSIQHMFLSANARAAMSSAGAPQAVISAFPRERLLKVRLEVDVCPAPGFNTTPGYLLAPLPFQVRCYSLADLHASKMHAVLCRRWRNRVKGRDWFDMVWFAANHPQLHLAHLDQKMRQSGDLRPAEILTEELFRSKISMAIEKLDVNAARREVEPFVTDYASLQVWSSDFFRAVAARIILV